MNETSQKLLYTNQLLKLEEIIESTNKRIVSNSPDLLFYENANFFTKAFLVTMCAYLESYIKDALMVIVDEFNIRLNSVKLPYNIVKWSSNSNFKSEFKSDYKFNHFLIGIKKKELDDFISGNPFRTSDLFKKFGIELEKYSEFESQKEIIKLIVEKRNRILHHNDEASDVSSQDLKMNIKSLIIYIELLDKIVCNQLK